MRLRIFGLHPRALVRFYRWRVRQHPTQELFAGVGIAIGVALVFAVQVANTSVTGSATQIVQQIAGSAQMHLAARSADGFDERTLARVEAADGVRHAAPIFRARGALVGRSGRQPVELVGITPALGGLGGDLTSNFGKRGLRLNGGIALPSGVATSIGAAANRKVTLLIGARAQGVFVGAVLSSDSIGPLAGSQVAVAPLQTAQALARQPGRLTQILVVAQPGREATVRRELERIAGGRLTVAPADADLRALRLASEPNDQSTMLFAAISAMVGFLFALNAMLLTSGERRRFIADLRVQGFDTLQVLTILVFEALMLGVVASLIGLALGDALSRLVFDDLPAYLSFAFPVGSQRVIYGSTIALAFGCGVLATLAASLRPMLDLRSSLPLDAIFREPGEAGEAIGPHTAGVLFAIGAFLVAATTLLVVLTPKATIAGGVTLAIAAVLVMPFVFTRASREVHRLSHRARGHANMVMLAMGELRDARTRSIALAAVGALAVYGSVAVGGAHSDVVRGLDRHTGERLSTADLWVSTGGDDLTTDSFKVTRRVAAIERVPIVQEVRRYHSAFLDIGDRRVWVVARPPTDRTIIPPSQVIEGDVAQATARVRRGGWATISNGLAEALHVGIGDAIELPAPTGARRVRVAAITTNLGWGPGAMILKSADYRRAWGSADPAALEVDLAPGVGPSTAKRALAQMLGPSSGLRVQTLAEREAQYHQLARQGLTRLSQISLLLLIAAVLAISAGLGAAIWQRRGRLATMKVDGFDRWRIWRMLLHETGFVVCVGCAVGAALGMYGHFLASRWLEATTGYPAPFGLEQTRVLLVLTLVAGAACVVTAIPGYAAARVPVRASMQE